MNYSVRQSIYSTSTENSAFYKLVRRKINIFRLAFLGVELLVLLVTALPSVVCIIIYKGIHVVRLAYAQ